MVELRLKANEFARSDTGMSWRWVMTRPGGAFLGDHEVRIDNSEWQYQAFTDLYGWLERHPDPAKGRLISQEEAVAGVGDWATERLFGKLAQTLADHAPCTVRVTLPSTATELAFMPLELARVANRPLAVQRVSLVIDLPPGTGVGDLPPGPVARAAGELRVLGLFSLPTSSAPLNLRKERYELERLVGGLSGSGRAITLRTLQYGATRESLALAVEDGDGWDVVHLAGHGRSGVFMLERPDGGRDPVEWGDLAGLLRPLRHRVKLVTVSSCESGDRVGRQQLELLRQGQAVPGESGDADHGTDGSGPRALASELAQHLGCAVVGMRYPVAESFAAAFTSELYRLMFEMRQPLATARASAVANTARQRATLDRPALSAGGPALYGATAIELRLAAPRSDQPPSFGPEITKLAGFPDQPARFVGRGAEMSRASQALSPRSGRSGIMLLGPAGTGKTALAVELAYTQRDNFLDGDNFPVLVWYAPEEDEADIRTSVGSFAAVLEQKITGLDLASLLDDTARIRAIMPRLTQFFESSRILVVIDHADSLLTEAGTWRDDRMGLLVEALVSHTGLGRLVVTTRRPVGGLEGASILTERIPALSLTEAVLLAREFPRLRDLMDGVAPPFNATSARGLARQVIKVTRGYPRLLELAAQRAADPIELARLALVNEQTWPDGDASAAYFAAVGAWTSGQEC